MAPISEHELNEVLEEELRPSPRPAFTAELDARVAAGFPRESRLRLPSRLREWKRRKALIPVGVTALAAIAAVAVVVGTQGSDSRETAPTGSFLSMGESPSEASDEASEAPAAAAEEFIRPDSGTSDGRLLGESSGAGSAAGSKRAIERSSQLTLGTEPENVGKAASEAFDVVHTYRGVVLSSQTSDGSAAHAEAEFELLIPSGKLGDAMAAFSRIAEVRSRHEATNDITAPTVSAAARLEDSRARIDSLLGQLAAAESEGERKAVERELRGERNRAAALQAGLANLERRASLSRVSLRIVGGEGAAAPGGGGSWGIGDALDDAGRVLGVAAAVTLLALAVLAPVALIALLIWLGRRTYLRRARQTALG